MRIGIEIGWAHKAGGSRSVTKNIIKTLSKLDRTNEYIVFANTFLPELEFPNVRQVIYPSPAKWMQHIWDQFIVPHVILPYHLRKEKIELVHYTNNYVSIFRPCKFVVTLHDLIPFIAPHTFGLLHRIYQQLYFKLAANSGGDIITISENSKNDIVKILKVPMERIYVVPEAVSGEFRVVSNAVEKNKIRKKYNLPDRIILNVGTIQPGKNLSRLFKAYKLAKIENNIPHTLVVVGRKGWKSQEIFDEIDNLGICDDVIFSGMVPQADLPIIYNLAELFVYPSIYEGFGLPPLEAMACGIPVITSNISSIPEVVGDAAVLIDPYDETELCEAMRSVLSDNGVRQELIEKGFDRVKEFSWEKAASLLLEIFMKHEN